jgi:hypothetical protein
MKRRATWLVLALLVGAAGAAVLLSPAGDGSNPAPMSTNRAPRLDLSAYAESSPGRPLRLLFIHHSCGGQLLAAPGPDNGTNCIYVSHPNGGGLRARLEQAGYVVHEASYGSQVGDATDIFDWLPKFQQQMHQILACNMQDNTHQDGSRNEIVIFKSCFPNNNFVSAGAPPGNSAGPELTVWNAKAAYTALLEEFRKRPEVLFVCVTAPPLAPQTGPQPRWKWLAKKILRRGGSPARSAPLAREFDNWLSGKDGWLKGGQPTNVVVFDYYDILTGCGASDLSCFPTGDGFDSHPNREGNQKAAQAFVPFLNRAVRRAGLAP